MQWHSSFDGGGKKGTQLIFGGLGRSSGLTLGAENELRPLFSEPLCERARRIPGGEMNPSYVARKRHFVVTPGCNEIALGAKGVRATDSFRSFRSRKFAFVHTRVAQPSTKRNW